MQHRFAVRTVLSLALLILLVGILIYLAISYLPAALNWVPDDYAYFLRWGKDARAGTFFYRYPLATLIWVFIPLSLMPGWFPVVWVIMPFIFTLILFGRKGIVVWLSYPFLVNAAFGQIDGCLLMPLYWLFIDQPKIAGIAAGILTLKPQLAIFPVLLALYRWLRNRNLKSLGLFSLTMLILHVPAFLLDPQWPLKMIIESQVRAGEWTQAIRGASLWVWWWHGGITVWVLPLILALVGYLVIRAFQNEWKQIRTMHLVGLLSIPIFYAVSSVTAISTLKNSMRHLILFTALSWISVVFDTVFQGFGGAFIIMPITALWLLADDLGDPAPQEKLRTQVER